MAEPARQDDDITIAYLTGQDAIMHWDGTVDAEHILQAIIEKRALAWVVSDAEQVLAVLVTRIAHHPTKSVLEVVTMGGEQFWRWAEVMQEQLAAYRKANDLECLRAYCRPGLSKWLRLLGWRIKQEVLEYG